MEVMAGLAFENTRLLGKLAGLAFENTRLLGKLAGLAFENTRLLGKPVCRRLFKHSLYCFHTIHKYHIVIIAETTVSTISENECIYQ